MRVCPPSMSGPARQPSNDAQIAKDERHAAHLQHIVAYQRSLKPAHAGEVRMYVCGMTVYDCHLGHARMLVSFDVVQRWLRASGYAVDYVRNITDIDDKIIRRAVETGRRMHEVTEYSLTPCTPTSARWACCGPTRSRAPRNTWARCWTSLAASSRTGWPTRPATAT